MTDRRPDPLGHCADPYGPLAGFEDALAFVLATHPEERGTWRLYEALKQRAITQLPPMDPVAYRRLMTGLAEISGV